MDRKGYGKAGGKMEFGITWKVFNCVNEFLKSGYEGKSMDEIASMFSEKSRCKKVSLFVYEGEREQLRLVGSTDDSLKENIGILKIKNTKFLEDMPSMKPSPAPEGIGLDGYKSAIKLARGDEIIGMVLVGGKVEEEEIQDLARDVTMALRFLVKYRQLEDSLKKYSLLGKFTDLFEKTKEERRLIDGVLEIAMTVLEAEGAFALEKKEDSYLLRITKNVKFKDKIIERSHPLIIKLESGESTLLVRKQLEDLAIDEIFETQVKSMIAVHYEVEEKREGILALVNKRESSGYKPIKHFDDLDLSVLKEIARRYALASARILYYMAIRDEVEKLEELRKRHEELITMLRNHIRKLNSVYVISQAMRSSYNLTNVYKILLLGVTTPRGLDFDRALLLVKDSKRQVLVGKMWAGFETKGELESYKKKASQRALRYGDAVQYFREEALTVDFSGGLSKGVEDRVFHYRGHPILERAVLRKRVFHVTPNLVKKSRNEIYDLVELVKTDDFVVMPLVGRWDTIGVIILDNKMTKRPINDMDVEVLKLIAESAGLAIENVMNYEELKSKTLSLERQKNLIDYLRKFSESILQNLDISVIVIDSSGKVLEWNRKSEQVFGRPRENMVGTQLSWLSPEFEDIWAVAGRVFEAREILYLSNYPFNISGEERYFDIKFSPLWSPDGRKVEGVIITFEDVTERYILELERKRQEKLAALGEMAARVAHELRNPISVIGGFLRRLQKHASNPELRDKYIEILLDEIKRLEEIVGEILEFSRDARKLDFSEFDVVELIREVYLLHEERFEEKGLEFGLITDRSEIEIFADKSRIKQVLINLIQNALDATPNGGKIRVTVEDLKDRVRVEVWNSGEPIPPDVKEKIFTPFFTTKVHGTGLGLPISKKIIEDEHRGKIWVESSGDGGTSFIFEIPKEKGD